MELTIIIVLGVIAIVVVAAVSEKIGVAAPLNLVLVGIGLSYLPGASHIHVEPDWILHGILPPLLYAAAVHIPAIDFRRDFKAIGGLAVLLVAVTTLSAGFVYNAVLPGLGLAAAFALGAVISPTDPVAATSVGKRLGLPTRLTTILEGEGLVNDASALVLLASATAAMTGHVSAGGVIGKFVYSVAIAVIIGWLVGHLQARIRSRLKDTTLDTAVALIVPFVAFAPAEAAGASGILAVVVTGLVAGREGPRLLPANNRMAESVNWSTIGFILENGVFLIMGLQLKSLVEAEAHSTDTGVHTAVLLGLLGVALVVAVRVVFVLPLVAMLRYDARRAGAFREELQRAERRLDKLVKWHREDRANGPSTQRLRIAKRRLTRRQNDVDFVVSENLGWRGGLVLAWSGMRGAVTVAAAQSLPADTPHRAQVLLIAFVVAAVTLLVQGVTLPKLITALHVPGDDSAEDRAELGDLTVRLSATAAELVESPDLRLPDGTAVPSPVRQRVAADIAPNRGGPFDPDSPEGLTREQYRQLMLLVLSAQRRELLRARDAGSYSSRVLDRAQGVLDLREARLELLPRLLG